nr:MAG TPA: hypothetical protein [Caudoviricetes sp.]
MCNLLFFRFISYSFICYFLLSVTTLVALHKQ